MNRRDGRTLLQGLDLSLLNPMFFGCLRSVSGPRGVFWPWAGFWRCRCPSPWGMSKKRLAGRFRASWPHSRGLGVDAEGMKAKRNGCPAFLPGQTGCWERPCGAGEAPCSAGACSGRGGDAALGGKCRLSSGGSYAAPFGAWCCPLSLRQVPHSCSWLFDALAVGQLVFPHRRISHRLMHRHGVFFLFFNSFRISR